MFSGRMKTLWVMWFRLRKKRFALASYSKCYRYLGPGSSQIHISEWLSLCINLVPTSDRGYAIIGMKELYKNINEHKGNDAMKRFMLYSEERVDVEVSVDIWAGTIGRISHQDDTTLLSKRRGSLEMNRRYRSTQSQQRWSWWPCALWSPRGECLAHVYQPCKEQTMQRGSKICRRSPHLYYFSAEILVGDLMFLKCWKFMSSWMFFEMVFFRVCSLIWKCKLPLMHWWTMVTNHSSWLMMRMKICHLSFHSTPNLMRIAFSFWARFRRRDMTGTWLEMLKAWGMRGMNCRVFLKWHFAKTKFIAVYTPQGCI